MLWRLGTDEAVKVLDALFHIITVGTRGKEGLGGDFIAAGTYVTGNIPEDFEIRIIFTCREVTDNKILVIELEEFLFLCLRSPIFSDDSQSILSERSKASIGDGGVRREGLRMLLCFVPYRNWVLTSRRTGQFHNTEGSEGIQQSLMEGEAKVNGVVCYGQRLSRVFVDDVYAVVVKAGREDQRWEGDISRAGYLDG